MLTLFRIARALLVHPQSHRAIVETEADWQHEVAGASTPIARLVVALSAAAALARALVLSSGRELATVPYVSLALRLAVVLLPLVLLVQFQQLGRLYGQLGGARAAEAALWLAPQSLAFCLPVAVFYAMARSTSHPVSPVGVGILIALTAALNRGWLVPVFNQEFREMVYQTLTGGGGTGVARGPTELTFWEALFSDDPRVWRTVSDTLFVPLVAASTVPLAIYAAGLGRARRMLICCAFPLGFAFTLFLGGLLTVLLREWIGRGWWQHGIDSLATWITMIAVQLGAGVWAWRAARHVPPGDRTSIVRC